MTEDLQLTGVEGQKDGKLCSSGEGGTNGKDLPVHTCMYGSAHDCRCMVNGSNASLMSIIIIIINLSCIMYLLSRMLFAKYIGPCVKVMKILDGIWSEYT